MFRKRRAARVRRQDKQRIKEACLIEAPMIVKVHVTKKEVILLK